MARRESLMTGAMVFGAFAVIGGKGGRHAARHADSNPDLLGAFVPVLLDALATLVITLAFGLLLGAITVAAALAFGLGARDVAGRAVEGWAMGLKGE